jgi:hypothetical protein
VFSIGISLFQRESRKGRKEESEGGGEDGEREVRECKRERAGLRRKIEKYDGEGQGK